MVIELLGELPIFPGTADSRLLPGYPCPIIPYSASYKSALDVSLKLQVITVIALCHVYETIILRLVLS